MKIKLPPKITITKRSSSLTNAFVNGIIPIRKPSEKQIQNALEILGQNIDEIKCIYCGDTATEWDHLNPLVVGQKPTGYITEIENLIPSCGKCNQSKGNRAWKDWIKSDAKLSPKTKGVVDIEERIKLIEKYERIFKPHKYDFKDVVSEELWENHWKNHEKLMKLLKEMHVTAELISIELEGKCNK